MKAITWPGNRLSIAFHQAIGFELEAGPGTQNLYGVPAYPDYDFGSEDRSVLVRRLHAGGLAPVSRGSRPRTACRGGSAPDAHPQDGRLRGRDLADVGRLPRPSVIARPRMLAAGRPTWSHARW